MYKQQNEWRVIRCNDAFIVNQQSVARRLMSLIMRWTRPLGIEPIVGKGKTDNNRQPLFGKKTKSLALSSVGRWNKSYKIIEFVMLPSLILARFILRSKSEAYGQDVWCRIYFAEKFVRLSVQALRELLHCLREKREKNIARIMMMLYYQRTGFFFFRSSIFPYPWIKWYSGWEVSICLLNWFFLAFL